MARNQGWNILTLGIGTAAILMGSLGAWHAYADAEDARVRDSNVAESVVHFAGDQPHVLGSLAEEAWPASITEEPEVGDNFLFLAETEAIVGIIGIGMVTGSVVSLRR